jgi:hypothetical protein
MFLIVCGMEMRQCMSNRYVFFCSQSWGLKEFGRTLSSLKYGVIVCGG